MRWTEYGLVDIIDVSKMDGFVVRQSLVMRNTLPHSQPIWIKYNSYNLTKMASVIAKYNTEYQYDLFDKSPLTFIRDVCQSVGLNFKLGRFSPLLKDMESNWAKVYGFDKIGMVFNPYLENEKNALATPSCSHQIYIDMIKNILQYNSSYPCEHNIEWVVMKSLERTIRVLSCPNLVEPTLRWEGPASGTEDLFGQFTNPKGTVIDAISGLSDKMERVSSSLHFNDDDTIYVLSLDGGGTR